MRRVRAARYTGRTGRPCNAGELWRVANASYLIDGSHERFGYFNRAVSYMSENPRGPLWASETASACIFINGVFSKM